MSGFETGRVHRAHPEPQAHPVSGGRPVPAATGPGRDSESFDAILRRELDNRAVRFSAHAEARIRMRNIKFTDEDFARLQRGVERVAAKGVRDTLVLLDGVALVVNVPNRTVITAVDGPSLKESVFTNIDGAVIA
ncbi:MAG TPA: flagellar biosynthesis protein [Firmicutes bacterium]|nr:flagellar biosynthesis protein [Bacillota bacterium]